MHRENFTAYETMPEDLAVYLSQNGPHFNKYAFEFAVSNMYKESASGKEEEIVPYTKNKVDELLKTYGIKLKHNHLYDAAYVATMCKADYLGHSIPTEEYLVKYIKDTLDDPDGAEGLTFNRWIADMKWLGIPIPWEEFL
ncbi:MAG: hypothetical protein J6M39_06450 [Lachnospiraceae bacterium]|nr:hypothetical protein [Lachnospiraceae bacterium]